MLTFMKATAMAAVGVAMAGAAMANPYKPYEGTTLVVNFPAHPHYDAVRKVQTLLVVVCLPVSSAGPSGRRCGSGVLVVHAHEEHRARLPRRSGVLTTKFVRCQKSLLKSRLSDIKSCLSDAKQQWCYGAGIR